MKKVFGKCNGYIESYFIYIMSLICILCSLQASIISQACHVLMKINDIYDTHWNKMLVINWINQNLNEIVDGSYNYQDIDFSVKLNEDTVEITVLNDNSQILLLINGDKIVKIL